jgi:hypothetical protein
MMEIEGAPAATSRKYEDVGLLIDIALWLGREKMIESAAPLELVRDFFLSHTIEECQQFFALLEDRADQLSRAIIGDTRANNTLLRALSEVRKRLSRTNDLVFAGRILMFMAYAFPLSDKSGTLLATTCANTFASLSLSLSKLLICAHLHHFVQQASISRVKRMWPTSPQWTRSPVQPSKKPQRTVRGVLF